MPLTPQITVTGNAQSISGSPDAASVVFELIGFKGTIPRISGTCVLVFTRFTAQANGSGNFSITLFGLDVITPANCFYQVTFLDDQGNEVACVSYDAFVGSGSFDLSQVTPMGQQIVAPAQPNAAVPQVFSPQPHQFLTGMNSTGVFSAAHPAFTDISGTASTGQIPNLPASIITSGLLGLVRGGTNADLSATGGTSQVLKQTTVGAAITVGQLAFTDISGTVAASQLSPGTASTLGGVATQIVVAHNFMTGINTSGFATIARPSAADLSDTATTGNVLRGNGTSFISAQLAAADLSNGTTGSGSVVLANTPTLITPNIGTATGTSLTTTGQVLSQMSGGQSQTGFSVQPASGTPGYSWKAPGAGTDQKWWDLIVSANTSFQGRLVNDANNSAVNWLTVNRGTGTAISSVTLWNMAVPNATDTFVGKNTADTLTNKTITTPTISSPVISGTVTSYNGISTVGNGLGAIVASLDYSATGSQSGTLVSSATAGVYILVVTPFTASINGNGSGGTWTLTVGGVQLATLSAGVGSGSGASFPSTGASGTNTLTNVVAVKVAGGASITYNNAFTGTAAFASTTNFSIRVLFVG